MTRPLAYHILRAALGPLRRSPRGMHRCDIEIGGHLLDAWPGEFVGLLPLPWGMQCFDRARVAYSRDLLLRYWAEGEAPEVGEVLRRLIATRQPPLPMPPTRQNQAIAWWRVARMLWGPRPYWGRSAYRLAEGSILFEAGHTLTIAPTGFHVGRLERLLAARPDIDFVPMIYDLLPLTDPALFGPGDPVLHRQMLDVVARRARMVIVGTATVAAEMSRQLAARGRGDMPVRVVPVGINPLFLAQPAPPSWQPAEGYALFCSSLEHQKNPLLLLDAWKILLARLGCRTPWLVLAGAPAGAVPAILQRLRANGDLAGRVRIVFDLPTAQIAQLMAGAIALLMPSRAEGFGLPPLEAMATGTPALAGDIPPMRDSAGEWSEFLPVDDPRPWADAVERLMPGRPEAAAARARLAAFRPLAQTDCAAQIMTLLQSLG